MTRPFLAATIVAQESGTNERVTLQVTGTPTGGTFTLLINTVPVSIAYNSTTTATATAINAALGASTVTVTGGTFPGATQTVEFTGNGYAGVDLPDVTLYVNALTGGTTPNVTITFPQVGVGGITGPTISTTSMSAYRGIFTAGYFSSINVAAAGTSMFMRTGDTNSSAIVVSASSHATSERAAITLGDWQVGQDLSANGTKNFFFWNGASRLRINPLGRITIPVASGDTPASETMRFVGDNAYIAFWEATEVTRRGYVQGVAAGLNVAADSGNLDLYGNGQLLRVNSGYALLNGQMRIGSWPMNTAYTGLVDRASGGAYNYIIMANTADTLISAPASGGTVALRSGNNDANTAFSINASDGARINRTVTDATGRTWGKQQLVLVANNVGNNDQAGVAFWVPANAVAPLLRCYGPFGERIDAIRNDNAVYIPLHASAFNVTSSIEIKTDVTELSDDEVLAKIGALRSKRFLPAARPVSMRPNARFAEVAARWAASGRTPLTPKPHHMDSVEHDCAIDNCKGTADNPCPIVMNDTHMFGLIAEELFEVAPEMVSLDEENRPAGYDVAQSAALAIGGVSALVRQVTKLVDRIEALEARLPAAS